jgi:hypothetical protein
MLKWPTFVSSAKATSSMTARKQEGSIMQVATRSPRWSRAAFQGILLLTPVAQKNGLMIDSDRSNHTDHLRPAMNLEWCAELRRGVQEAVLIALSPFWELFSFTAAIRVPSTRARIFSNAISREVEGSSANGENPQSSVVPNCDKGKYSAARKTRSQTCSRVSTTGFIGSTTPTKTLTFRSGGRCWRMILRTRSGSGSLANRR